MAMSLLKKQLQRGIQRFEADSLGAEHPGNSWI